MRYSLKDQTGTIVNIIELEAGANWEPPAGHTAEPATETDEIVRPPPVKPSKKILKLKSKSGEVTEYEVVE